MNEQHIGSEKIDVCHINHTSYSNTFQDYYLGISVNEKCIEMLLLKNHW